MLQLSRDATFHVELLRVLGAARDGGSDVAEVLGIADRIEPGNFESWHSRFNELAHRVRGRAEEQTKAARDVSARNAFFRAASYFRAADFFLHGNPADPRISEIWRYATTCFDSAIKRLDVPGERLLLSADGFQVPTIFYRVATDGWARPTILLCNGFDGSQEEMLHVSGFAALARGFNVLTFEGPGQPTVIRDQGLAFIDEWEKVVIPLLDWCERTSEVDATRVGLIGYSFGGYLAPRAAAFEHRLAAIACVDGLFDMFSGFTAKLPAPLHRLMRDGDVNGFNRSMIGAMAQQTNLRWAVGHGCWVFGCDTPYAFIERARSLTLKEVVGNIRCPVLICDAEDDHFFKGQPKALAAALGPLATYRVLTATDAASAHCHVGASDFMNSTVMGWFEDAFPHRAGPA